MRGFVVLVVLLMLAVISAVAIGQLSVASGEAIVSVRKEEEAQARAIAEGCLLLMQRHADYYMGATNADPPPSPPTPPGGDFDLLLNPDGNGGGRNGDEHVPAASGSLSAARRVEIPGNASPPATSEHQYLMVPRAGGACFIRFEDNSDDDLAAGATMADTTDTNCRGPGGVDEGTGVDVNYCDSDGAIYMTAIGVYPKLGTDGEVYSKAHARVTLRKLYQVAQPGSAPSAIIAGGTVDINNNITVCGAGGIQAEDVTGKLKGTSCMCGSVATEDDISSTTLPLGSTCCPNCSPGSQTTGVPAPRPIEIDNGAPVRCTGAGCALHGVEDGVPESPMQPQPPNFMGNQIFGNPRIVNNTVGDPASCKVFMRHDGAVFYWDRFDTNTATMFPLAPSDNCATYNSNPVGQPCTYLAGVPLCVGNQTTCWKPLATVGDGAQSAAAPSAILEMTNLAGTHLNYNNNALPNSANPAAHFGLPNDANKLCGSDPTDATTGNSCANCSATGSADTARYPAGSDGDDWQFTANANNNNMPVPLIMAIGPIDTADVDGVVGGGTPNGPLIATISTVATLRLAAGSSLCCHNCGCQEMLAVGKRTLTVGSSPPPPAATTVECTMTAPNQGASYPNMLLPQWARFGMLDPAFDAPGVNADGPMPKNRSVPGFVAYADQNFNLSSSTYVGLLWGAGSQQFSSNPNLCVVGRWVVDGSVDFDSSANVNVAGEWLITEDLDGGDAVNGIVINVDTVFVEDDATFKNNWVMNGRFIVGRNLSIKNSATINFFGGGAEGSFGTGALSSFMESQW